MPVVRRYTMLVLATTACGRFGFGEDDVVVVPPDTMPPGVALVQQVTAFGPGTSLTATLPALPAAGNMLVIVGAIQSGALASVSGGATWQLARYEDTYSNVEIWYGVADGTSATVQIAGAVTSELWISLHEWRGLATANTLDATAATFGTTSPASAGAITCGDAGDLVIFAVSDMFPSTFGSPTGGDWTALVPPTTAVYIEQPWYTLGAPFAMFDPTVTETGGHWGAVIAALRVAQ